MHNISWACAVQKAFGHIQEVGSAKQAMQSAAASMACAHIAGNIRCPRVRRVVHYTASYVLTTATMSQLMHGAKHMIPCMWLPNAGEILTY